MAEATLSKGTPIRLFVPTKLTSRGTRSEVQMAFPSKFRRVIIRGRTLSLVVRVFNVDFLYVSTVSDGYVNRSTWIQCIVEDSVHSLICVNLKRKWPYAVKLPRSSSNLSNKFWTYMARKNYVNIIFV